MRTVTYNMQQFLTEAKREAFVIPHFQRPFGWNHAQFMKRSRRGQQEAVY